MRSGDPSIVIIGAGFGGLAAAQALKNGRAKVTLIDRQNCHVFQPLLYQVATGDLAASEIAVPVRDLFRRNIRIRCVMDEMVRIDRERRRVFCRASEHQFDYLIVATGSQYDYFGHDAWRERAPPLKSLSDAIQIRERVLRCFERAELASDEKQRRRLLTFAIVGGGATGVELSGAIADLARSSFPGEFRSFDPSETRVCLFEAEPRLLPGFSPELQDYAHRALLRKGVDVKLNSPVTDISDGRISAGEETCEAETVVWAAGVKAGDIAQRLGVKADKRGRIDVAPDLSLPGDADIFVVGDAALSLNQDGRPLPALAAVAQQQGTFVGRLLKRRMDGEASPSVFRYRDLGLLATIGRNAAVADFNGIRFTGFAGWLIWGLVHIYLLIGFRNRLVVFVNWFWAYLTRRRGSALIVDASSSALRAHQSADDERRANE